MEQDDETQTLVFEFDTKVTVEEIIFYRIETAGWLSRFPRNFEIIGGVPYSDDVSYANATADSSKIYS
jgi:hypothetical protein